MLLGGDRRRPVFEKGREIGLIIVVVEIGVLRAERVGRELPQHVLVFIQQPGSGNDTDRITAGLLLHLVELLRRVIERLIPGRRYQLLTAAYQRTVDAFSV